ncbi:MAG: DUF1998 domain-containing protein [Candidatus Accumulibacter sp.]|uniref:DUF1998 domain-containing protein n=1 Tax=Candidatus Accumulibacter affinis TaxID=2954384 RepID=A0A935TGD1_9PROT|nr:DUF1998 domain-containing protein [Candidatus Accumulibacter affinis]
MSKKTELIPVRLSHLLRHCSVGAIVRGPDYLMTVKDIREWTDRSGKPAGEPIRYVDGVRSALGIKQELREPPVAKALDTGRVEGECVPGQRFPSWMRCPSCGLLHYKPWRGLSQGEKSRCQESDPKKCQNKPQLEQAPWALIHVDGHMADVPWHFLAHPKEGKGAQNQQQCRADWNEPYLRLIDKGASGRKLRCERCNAISDFGDGLQIPFGKTRQQPWIKEDADATDSMATVLEINDARVHAPQTRNALVIPPESRIRKGSVVDRLYSSSPKLKLIEQAKYPLARNSAMNKIASELRCSIPQIEDALKEIGKGYPLYGQNITQGILLENEYQALCDEMPDVADDEDFVTHHHTCSWKAMIVSLAGTKPARIIAAVSQLIAVNRLKEIMVLKGFQRMGGTLVLPDIVGESSWLPALELYGEGVFFSLDEDLLSRWESHPTLSERSSDFQRRFAATGLRFDPEIIVTPRFLLLHTLAHLLIRQLETEAGYPAASLKERIYCTAGKLPMSGILVYVAVPDVVGSLGGLAELATPERFLLLLSSVFDHAEWCSLDPVCSEHGGQGPSLLNRAACHACALIPEPSCAYGNVLLDRTFIKGDVATGMPAFLSRL